MRAVNGKWMKWQQVAGIGMVCGLAVAGCNRSDNADSNNTEVAEPEVVVVEDDTAVASAVNCNDPMVQDRLKNTLKNTLNQQAQTIAASYANDAEVSLDNGVVSSKVNGVLIDVQNAAILQQANANGVTTCQASVSMTLPSEDLYQASLVRAANNEPSLSSRLTQNNIRINNNMLIDDAFTYVVGMQGGQVQTRIAGRPVLMTAVADVMASSVIKAEVDDQRAQRQAQQAQAERRSAEQDDDRIPEPTAVQPVEPVQPTPAPTINQDNTSAAQNNSKPNANATAQPSASVPTDDSIDMVIIEDGNATY